VDQKKVTLDTINSGAAIDLFNEEFSALLKNLADENTSPTKTRTITLKVTVKPNETRESAATMVEVSHSFAPMKPHAGMVVFSSDGRNIEAFAVSQGKQPDLPGVIQFAEKAGGQN
jgi:hypothetical protein